jgi:hypothetical protein
MKQILTFTFLILLIIVVVTVLGYTATAYPIVLTGIAAAIGFLGRWVIDSIKENRARLHEKKRQVYSSLLKPWVGVLVGTINKNQSTAEAVITSDTVAQAVEAAFDTILYGSDDVVLRYGEFRNLAASDTIDVPLILYRFATVLLSMRKDIGHTFTTVDEIDILAMFINMNDAERKRNKETVKTLKKNRDISAPVQNGV